MTKAQLMQLKVKIKVEIGAEVENEVVYLFGGLLGGLGGLRYVGYSISNLQANRPNCALNTNLIDAVKVASAKQ